MATLYATNHVVHNTVNCITNIKIDTVVLFAVYMHTEFSSLAMSPHIFQLLNKLTFFYDV